MVIGESHAPACQGKEYIICEILNSRPLTSTPLMSDLGLQRLHTKGKSNGENGHPCLVLFEMLKEEEATKGVLIEADGAAYKCLFALRNGPRKPKCSRVVNMKGQLSLLKAFSASRLSSSAAIFCLLAMSIKLMTLLVLSPACRQGTKPT